MKVRAGVRELGLRGAEGAVLGRELGLRGDEVVLGRREVELAD